MARSAAAPVRVMMLPHYGDSNPYLRLLTQALASLGVTVDLVRPRGRTPLWRAVREYGRPDVVHLHWQHRFFVPRRGGWSRAVPRTLLFFLQWLTLRVQGTRFVWTVHNVTNHEGDRRRWELAANRLLARVVDRLIVHCAAVVTPVSKALRVSPRKFDVCAHGTYGDWYSGPDSREDARAELGLPQDERILLYFGMIRSYKGVESLIETFSRLEGEHLHLIVLGLPKSEELKRTIGDLAQKDARVEACLEFVADDRLAAHLKACDVVVLPYRDSLTSGAAVLAGAAHRPVVMPKLGCMNEFPDDAGYFYDPQDPSGLQTALLAACSEQGDQRGEAAARHVNQFTWDDVGATLVGIYAGLGLGGGSRAVLGGTR